MDFGSEAGLMQASSYYDPSGFRLGTSNSQLFASCSSLGGSSRLKREMDEIKQMLKPEQGRTRATNDRTVEAIARLEPLLDKGRDITARRGKLANPPMTEEEKEAEELAGIFA